MRRIELGLVFAIAPLMLAAQAKACGCHEKRVVSRCDPCATRVVAYRSPCGCGSTYTYGNGYYYDYPVTYSRYDSYGERTYPASYSTYGSSSGRYLTFDTDTGRYVPYPTFESSSRTIDYRD